MISQSGPELTAGLASACVSPSGLQYPAAPEVYEDPTSHYQTACLPAIYHEGQYIAQQQQQQQQQPMVMMMMPVGMESSMGAASVGMFLVL